MDLVFEAYIKNVEELSWIDDAEKAKIIKYTNHELKKFIGYHENLETLGPNFYDTLKVYPEDEFFNIGFSLKVFSADWKFKVGGALDWSKYSQPHTVNALFSSADSSVRKLKSQPNII